MPVLPLWNARCGPPMASSSSFRDRDMIESSQYLEGEVHWLVLGPKQLGERDTPLTRTQTSQEATTIVLGR
jgi:hypothetical protein